MTTEAEGRLLPVHDTRLFVAERGRADGVPLLLLHGGPGLDHREFADYLDPLGETYRLVLVDQRAQGRSDRDVAPETLSLAQMASDVSAVAAALGARRYAVLGHSFGAFVALQHAVDAPGAAAATIVSGGVPATSWLAVVEDNLAAFEPAELRMQVTESWSREPHARTEDDVAALIHDQLPFHFADPRDPRITEFEARVGAARYAPDVLRHFALEGGSEMIEVADRLGDVRSPLLACTGRHDRTCVPAATEAIAAGVPDGRAVIFEQSGHMTYVEEPERYLQVVGDFLAGALAT